MGKKPYIVAGIPAFNEEKTIAKVVLLTKKYVDKVVVVDDGSTDMTAEIAEALGAEVIRHKVNLGKGAALRTLFAKARECGADVLVLLDADDQHNPQQISDIIEPIIKNEADIVIGSRFLGKSIGIPKYRKVGLKVLSKIIATITKNSITDPLSGFRALSKKALAMIDLLEKGYGVEVEMLLKAVKKGLRICEVPITVNYTTGAKTSKKHPIVQGAEIISAIIRRTVEKNPLVFMGIPGFLNMLTGMYFIGALITIYNHTRYFSLPMAIIALGFITAGIILLTSAVTIYLMRNLEKKIIAHEYRMMK